MRWESFVWLAVVVLASAWLVACGNSQGPSKSDVENVALHKELAVVACDQQSVQVVQIGKPSTLPAPLPYMRTVKAWPAKVDVVCMGNRSELREIWVYKNSYGEWDVLASYPYGQ
jgi:hypothetical protein